MSNLAKDYMEKKYKPATELETGDTILVPAWKDFREIRMTCIKKEKNKDFSGGFRYHFDNGIKWSACDLQSNLKLWTSRGGYEIIKNN